MWDCSSGRGRALVTSLDILLPGEREPTNAFFSYLCVSPLKLIPEYVLILISTQIFYPPPLPLVLTHPSLLFLFNQEEVYDLLLDNAIFYQDQRGLRCYRCRYVSNPIE